MATYPGATTMKFTETPQTTIAAGPLKGLPLVICGPLLRKVHYDSVSVWLAFQAGVTNIRLDVFEASKPAAVILTGNTEPLKMGKCLFVSLVTALGNTRLRPDVIYGYRVSFRYNGKELSLETPRVLNGGIRSISYDPFSFPTFCLPSDNINNLKIVHGSCRKPHGGKTDALRGLDTMLELYSKDISNRPQLLCLTGDQIYADDVADALLYKINENKQSILGWKDTVPVTRTYPNGIPSAEFRPGYRKNIIAKTGDKSTGGWGIIPGVPFSAPVRPDDLTTTDSKSHLVFLSEFLLMYLFAYSDSFLKYNQWPSFESIYTSAMSPAERAAKVKTYTEEIKGLNSFTRSLPYIKKALANISSVMIFDDHDITDDWFITAEWSKNALMEQTLSRRYILNGLTAYAIFQDWGNDYKKYLPGTIGYAVLLTVANQQLPSKEKASRISNMILPKIERNEKEKYWELKNSFSWNYVIRYNGFDLCVMNTRTERVYFDNEGKYPALTRTFYPPNMMPDPRKLMVLVSAVPVFGNIEMEDGQRRLGSPRGFFDRLAAGISKNTGPYARDQEGWLFSHTGYQKLLNFLTRYKKVVILSGEVHYAFTSYIRLWKEYERAKYALTEIVQVTSSSLKNSASDNYITAAKIKTFVNVVVNSSNPYKLLKVIGTRFNRFSKDLTVVPNPQFYNITHFANGTQLNFPPESFSISNLQFSMQYIRSAHYNYHNFLFKRILGTSQKREFRDTSTESSFHHTVVVKDSISLLSFTANSVTNNIWYANGRFNGPDDAESNRLMFPYTRHIVQFKPAFTTAELPISELSRITRTSLRSKELEFAY